jgi:hypothetical protein
VKRPASWLVRAAMRRGWSRGVVEGDRTWVVVGGLALLAHLAGRALKRDEDVVFHQDLRPGESFLITHRPNP